MRNGFFSCRVLTRGDLGLLPAMERIEARAHRHPWSEGDLRECFGDLYRIIGLFAGGTLTGFAVIYATRVTTDLLTIGVDPDSQGRGLGTLLLRAALREAVRAGADECFLEVRAGNTAAQGLYRKFGFKVTGVRRGYYAPLRAGGSAEDALTMRLDALAAAGFGG